MMDLADLTAEFTTLSAYVLALSALVLGAIGFKYGYKAAWTAIKSALGIATTATKGGGK